MVDRHGPVETRPSMLQKHDKATCNANTACRSRLAAISRTAASAKDVIVRYYDAYNAGDIDTIDSLLADECSYHNMIYEEPFRGR